MQKGTFTFELLDKYPPDVVFKNSLKQIEESTNGYVIGNIEKYNRFIFPYTKTSGILEALGLFDVQSKNETSDVYSKLGEQDAEQNTFEVFLTAKELEHYKYRMMFIEYSTISYPVTVVMNEELSVQYTGKRNKWFLVESMKELEDMIDKVINSSIIVSLIQNLINESLRQEAKGKDVI